MPATTTTNNNTTRSRPTQQGRHARSESHTTAHEMQTHLSQHDASSPLIDLNNSSQNPDLDNNNNDNNHHRGFDHDTNGNNNPSSSRTRHRNFSNPSRFTNLDDVAEASESRRSVSIRTTDLPHQNRGHIRNRSTPQPVAPVIRSQFERSLSPPPPPRARSKPMPVSWASLPQKGQLAILGLCRVFDFLQIASLQAYMFYQLKSFSPDLSDSDISTQAGILQGAFTAAQFATAIPWGRVADAPWGGRKFVLLVGLVGTAISCIGVAFATTFTEAVFWRSFGGAINGTVGIIRTMIAENVKEKKYHSRAFLILPIGFNIAALFGPGEIFQLSSRSPSPSPLPPPPPPPPLNKRERGNCINPFLREDIDS
jgi:hypothetical protein